VFTDANTIEGLDLVLNGNDVSADITRSSNTFFLNADNFGSVPAASAQWQYLWNICDDQGNCDAETGSYTFKDSETVPDPPDPPEEPLNASVWWPECAQPSLIVSPCFQLGLTSSWYFNNENLFGVFGDVADPEMGMVNNVDFSTDLTGRPGARAIAAGSFGDAGLMLDFELEADIKSGEDLSNNANADFEIFYAVPLDSASQSSNEVKELSQGCGISVNNLPGNSKITLYNDYTRTFVYITDVYPTAPADLLTDNNYHRYKVRRQTGTIRLWIDDVPIFNVVDTCPYDWSYTGFGSHDDVVRIKSWYLTHVLRPEDEEEQEDPGSGGGFPPDTQTSPFASVRTKADGATASTAAGSGTASSVSN
jgi:hypothetical protein